MTSLSWTGGWETTSEITWCIWQMVKISTQKAHQASAMLFNLTTQCEETTFFCQLGPDLSCGFGYYVLLCQRSYSFQHKILRIQRNPCADFLVNAVSTPSFNVANPSLLSSVKYSQFAFYHPIGIEFYRAGFGGLFPSDTMTRWESQDTMARL